MVNNLVKHCGCFFIIISFATFAMASGHGDVTTVPKGMVKIPAGTYLPFFTVAGVKTVKVASFYLDKYAVTNAEFLLFVKANPKWKRSSVSRLFADTGYLLQWKSDYVIANEIKSSPVTNVSWFAANAYSKWKGKRLPTMNEWEYAGNSPAADDKRPVEKIILDWYSRPNPAVLPAIGSTFTNRFNVGDLHGLIWEWVSDFNSVMMNGDSRSSSSINKDLFCASGSAGAVDKENYAAFMRFAFRGSLQAKYTVKNLGFRCASDVK